MNYNPNKISIKDGMVIIEPNYCYDTHKTPLGQKLSRRFLSQKNKWQIYKVITACLLSLTSLLIFPALSVHAFDLDAGIKAVVDPFSKGVVDHYGKVILILGAGGAVVASGDLRTRAFGFGIGSGLAGAAVLMVKATLGIA
jgi:hypothetical protein